MIFQHFTFVSLLFLIGPIQTSELLKDLLIADEKESARPVSVNSASIEDNNDPGIPIKWNTIIEGLLEVRCSSTQMTVLLHYQSSYSRLTPHFEMILRTGSLFAGPKPTVQCTGMAEEDEGSIVIRFGLKQCGLLATHASNETVLYETTLTYEAGQPRPTNFHINEHFMVQCIHPVHLDQQAVTQQLELYDTRYSKEPWQFPKKVTVGDIMVLESIPTIPWYKDKDLYSLPVKCWTSPLALYESDTPKKYFFNEGCPANDRANRGLSRKHQFTLAAVRVTFNLGWYLLFREQMKESTDSAIVYVHCEVIPCIQSYTKGILNIPKCPISHYCAGIPSESHNLPEYLRDVPVQKVSLGPIVAQTSSKPLHLGQAEEMRCKMQCIRQLKEKRRLIEQLREMDKSPKNSQTQPKSVYIVKGVSTVVAVAISVASFLLGILLMGALWFVHVNTDPNNKGNRYNGPPTTTCHSRTPMAAHQNGLIRNGCQPAESGQPTTQLMLNPL